MSIFQLQKDTGIYEIQQNGKIKLDTIRLHYQEIMAIETVSHHFKILIDCSAALFDMDINDIERITAYVKHALSRCQKISEAIVVNQPYETAVTTLYLSAHADIPHYNFQVFSTKEAAVDWLLRD